MIILFMFNVREKNYDYCYKLMDEYSVLSGHVVKANYMYNKTLLDFIVHNRPLYIYQSDFAETPELHHQLEVIKALKAADLERAGLYWRKLAKHNPDLYRDNFECRGEDTLFTQALKLCRLKQDDLSFDQEELEKIPTKQLKLKYILSKSSIPIPQEKLIELIYHEELNELSQIKLRRLIADYAKKYGQQIKSYQSTYQLIKKSS